MKDNGNYLSTYYQQESPAGLCLYVRTPTVKPVKTEATSLYTYRGYYDIKFEPHTKDLMKLLLMVQKNKNHPRQLKEIEKGM